MDSECLTLGLLTKILRMSDLCEYFVVIHVSLKNNHMDFNCVHHNYILHRYEVVALYDTMFLLISTSPFLTERGRQPKFCQVGRVLINKNECRKASWAM